MIACLIDWYPILHQRSKIFFFLTIVFRFPSSFQLSSGYLWKMLRYCLAKGSIKKLSLLIKNRNKKIVVFYFSCFFFYHFRKKDTQRLWCNTRDEPAQYVKCRRLFRVESLGILSRFKKRKENSSSYVYVLHDIKVGDFMS